MLRRMGILAAAMLMLGACNSSSDGDVREVLVDYSPEEVATFVASNYPKKVQVAAGQTIVFKQTWTGEPHTLTGGSKVNEQLAAGSKWIDFFTGFEELVGDNDLPDPENPGDETMADLGRAIDKAKPAATARVVRKSYEALAAENPKLPKLDSDASFADSLPIIDEVSNEAFEGLPFAADETEDDDFVINQNYGQECYLKTGLPPEDADKPCTKAQQEQPAFDDSYDFYNSGILPYEGPRGNTYRMEIAEDTKPGTYYFYCAIHGPGQLSEIEVKEPGADVPSPSEVARAARDEAEEASSSFEKTFRDATKTNKVEYEGDEIDGPFAGLPTQVHGMINEFVPRTIRATVNEPITWKVIGGDHTISFDVPPYLPIVEFSSTRIRLNPKVRDPQGGAPKQPRIDGESEEPIDLDGGTWDGDGFWSSGVVGAEPWLNYTVRISKAGTYPYACLIHPKMIGQVIVE